MMNFTPLNQTANIYDTATYNSGCITEINKILDECTKFKADVLSTMSNRFKIAVIILIVLILVRFFLEYSKYKDNPTIIFILARLNWVLIVTALCTIALMFL